jgi:GDPmannose 4,6-dehydratase
VTTAFITGITGQDGSYLAERLLAEGVAVHGLVQSRAESVELVSRCPDVVLHEGDLTDTDSVAGLLGELEPDEVYNLAGISSVALSWREPVLTGRVTGLGAVGVMQGGLTLQERTGRPVRMVQASSAEIFGDPVEVPQRETTLIRPSTPYGAAKAYAHQMAAVYRSRGLAVSTVILYNHESPRRPEAFVTRKITAAAARIARGEQERLSLGTLTAKRDWGWAPDYVAAAVLALRHPEPDDYVIATGVSHTVADFVTAAFAAVGIVDWQSRVDLDPAFARTGDAAEQRGDASKAREVLGWTPTLSFEQIVAAMVQADLS